MIEKVCFHLRSYANVSTPAEQETIKLPASTPMTEQPAKRPRFNLVKPRTETPTNSSGILNFDDEYMNYSNMNIHFNQSSNPRQFYRELSKQFPILSEIAKRVFCITASSVPSESLFSKAGYVVSKTRNCLAPEDGEQAVMLRDNMDLFGEKL